MKLGEENTKMTGGFNDLLNKRFLFFEVRLKLRIRLQLAAAHEGLRVTDRLAFSTKLANIEPALREDGLDPFGLIGVLGMVAGEHHWLNDSTSIFQIPSIPHTGPRAFAAAFTSLFFVRPIGPPSAAT
jgi:hypothetical protein